jgi:hypothetical protein
MAHTRFDALADTIGRRSPVVVNGTSYTMVLRQIRSEPLKVGSHLDIAGRSSESEHHVELFLDLANYTDEQVATLAVDSLTQVIDGRRAPATDNR